MEFDIGAEVERLSLSDAETEGAEQSQKVLAVVGGRAFLAMVWKSDVGRFVAVLEANVE